MKARKVNVFTLKKGYRNVLKAAKACRGRGTGAVSAKKARVPA